MPADCVLLSVNENKSTQCFVQTAALDGERNLKPKLVSAEFAANLSSIMDPSVSNQFPHLTLDCIPPSKAMHEFQGRLEIRSDGKDSGVKLNVDINEFLHAGSVLANSVSVLALVCYTGT